MMSQKKTSNSGLFHRVICAVFNTYPFSTCEETDEFYRSGKWDEFLKGWLDRFRTTKIKSESPLTNFASCFSILSFISGIVFYFLPSNNSDMKVLILPMLLVIFGINSIFSVLVLLIWNDKKNYCLYYEQLVKSNHDILEDQIQSQKREFEEKYEFLLKRLVTFKSILGNHLHALAEEFRVLCYLLNADNRDDQKCIDSFRNYLDILCEITSQYFIEHKEKIGTNFVDKYACCIKIFDENNFYKVTTVDDLQVKTLVRSRRPIDVLYNKRLEKYAKNYDLLFTKISDNTDFNTILREKRWKYYLPNFIAEVEKETYKTSHPDGHKYYKSAVSFPVIYRINNGKSTLLGYLCFDNYTTDAFPTCRDDDMLNANEFEFNREEWQEFCCSQIDFLSIAIAKFLKFDITKTINPALALGPIKKAR